MTMYKRIGLIVLVFFSFFFLFQSSYADPPLPTPVGRVVWIKGTLKAVMPSNELRILQKMSVIYLHDTLITDANTQAEIVLTDDSLMTFYPNTKFVVDQYSYQKTKKGLVGKYFMNLLEGGFRTITGLIAKNSPNDYQVSTPVATIGVRGTDYAVYIKGSQLFIGQYAGRPCVAGKNQKHSALCLDDKTKYANVPSLGADPVPLAQQPDVFNQKLEIISFKISPFGTVQTRDTGGGAITSFCITG